MYIFYIIKKFWKQFLDSLKNGIILTKLLKEAINEEVKFEG